jgi:allantoinase
MSRATSRLAGLDSKKGRLAEGLDADIIVFDPDARCSARPGKLLSPYQERDLFGNVVATYVAGENVMLSARPN